MNGMNKERKKTRQERKNDGRREKCLQLDLFSGCQAEPPPKIFREA
jgi:hypothetical protein